MDITQISGAKAENIQRAASNVDAACEAVRGYIQKEESRQAALWDRINACNAVFENLSTKSAALLQNAEDANAKIKSAYAAQEVIANADAILRDIHETLPALVRNDGIEKEKQIRRILDTLNTISYQCGQLQTFPKPYRDIIDLYNRKIESIFDTLRDKKLNSVLQIKQQEIGKLKEEVGVLQRAKDDNSSEINRLQKLLKEKDTENNHLAASLKQKSQSATNNSLNEVSKKWKGGCIAAIIVLGISFVIMGSMNNNNAILLDEKTGMESAISSLKNEVSAKESEINSLKSETNVLTNKVRSVEKEISALQQFKNEKVNMENKISSLENKVSSTESEVSSLQRYIRNYHIIQVTGMQVGNWGNSQWINRPGARIRASDVRYLNPVFTYNALVSGQATFYIKIIRPDGVVFRNSSTSPAGYTLSSSKYIQQGTSLSLDPSGWGNASASSYYAGTWKIELWYEGACLYSGEVTLL